jgi:glycosyltransferase involved in cell wall biosynthesis
LTSVAVGVDQLWYDVPGGVGTYIRNLIPAMLAREPSLDVALFHSRFHRSDPDEPWMRGLRVETIASTTRSLYPTWNLVGRPALPPSLARADVVHATTGVAIPPVGARQRLVVTIHDLAFLRYPDAFDRRWRLMYRLGLRAAVRRAAVLVVPSTSTRDDLLEHTRLDPSRVRVVPLAAAPPPDGDVDTNGTLDRLGVPRPYVLYVGTLEARKNLDTLVRAYRRVATRVPHALVLAGPRGWRTDALERARAEGGAGRVERIGPLSPDDLDVVYRNASAFVYPSRYEGFGLPVLEAMVRGVPTIASNASSLPEVAGDAALLVDPRSVEDLADAIERVLTDDALAARLSADGRRRAARFSWDETARLTLAAYDAVQPYS